MLRRWWDSLNDAERAVLATSALYTLLAVIVFVMAYAYVSVMCGGGV